MILCCGESLIDLIPADGGGERIPYVGGAVLNTAVALGRLGEEPISPDPKSGASGGEADERPPDGMEAAEGRVMIRKESTQAAEVLLRQIRDNPGLVLRARLRAAHKARQKSEGACDGC